MKCFTLTLFSFLSFVYTQCIGQTIDTAIDNSFKNYVSNNLHEKLYVHTDKNSYLAGEIIWFKVYNVEAFTNIPINVSKIAYIELLDENNKAIFQAKISLTAGKGAGHIYLPISLSSGNFVLRTYTHWMKNFDANFYFHKELTIYNTLKADTPITAKQVALKPAVQFFPEGGNLVSGLSSKVAFKAVDYAGKPLKFKGFVINNQTDTILKFNPQQFGLGSFIFLPKENQNYQVLIQPEFGKPFYAELPTIFPRGAVMTVGTEADSLLKISIQQNFEPKQKFALFVHSGIKVVYSKTLSTDEIAKQITISISKLGDGISHLTLFTEDLQPICERLYFKKPLSLLNVLVSTTKKEFSNREKINVLIEQNQQSKPVPSNFSISVYQTDSLAQGDDIASSIWLTSELNGKIENPSWYLKNANNEAIDLLMLTHGWRRFNWKSVLAKAPPAFKFQPEINGPIISGRLISFKNQPLANLSAYLSIVDEKFKFYTTPLTSNGDINFFTKDYYGRKKIIVQLDSRLDSLAKIELYSPYSTEFASFQPNKFKKDFDVQKLLDRSVGMQVHNAFYANYLKKEMLPAVDTTVFYHHANKSYKLDDYVRFASMEDVLREYVFEVTVAKRNKDYHLRVFDTSIQQFLDSPPMILVDGFALFDDGNALMNIDPKYIKNIDIVTGKYIYGANKFDGILSLQTYKGNLNGIDITPRAIVLDNEGLQLKREFYAPMYNGDTAKSARIADYRNTLFWSPDNETQKDGKANLSFYSADFAGNYIIVVQALSPNGGVGSGFANFNIVEKK